MKSRFSVGCCCGSGVDDPWWQPDSPCPCCGPTPILGVQVTIQLLPDILDYCVVWHTPPFPEEAMNVGGCQNTSGTFLLDNEAPNNAPGGTGPGCNYAFYYEYPRPEDPCLTYYVEGGEYTRDNYCCPWLLEVRVLCHGAGILGDTNLIRQIRVTVYYEDYTDTVLPGQSLVEGYTYRKRWERNWDLEDAPLCSAITGVEIPAAPDYDIGGTCLEMMPDKTTAAGPLDVNPAIVSLVFA